jgi:hypothetical protein
MDNRECLITTQGKAVDFVDAKHKTNRNQS